jgi:nitrogen regulatory protein PII
MLNRFDNSVFSKDKLITCILPKGTASPILLKLRDEKNINRVHINSARGMGRITPLAYRGAGEQAEKEILSVIVEEDQADDIFYYIYEEADIDRPHGGIIYMRKLDMSTLFTLPDLPNEE